MKPWLTIACAAALAALAFARDADAGKSDYDAMVATHARANHVPEALVHRVIQRESKYQPQLIGHGGTIGLMQIKLATAKGLGYTGDAEGLRDPDTNLTYGVKYLAGAYRAADGDHERAMHFFAAGYYEAAKQLRLELAGGKRLEADGNPHRRCPVMHRESCTKRLQWWRAPGFHRRCRSSPPAQRRLRRVDSPNHRLTLDRFRGELRGGAEIPQAWGISPRPR